MSGCIMFSAKNRIAVLEAKTVRGCFHIIPKIISADTIKILSEMVQKCQATIELYTDLLDCNDRMLTSVEIMMNMVGAAVNV